MEKMTIQENPDNDLKYRDGLLPNPNTKKKPIVPNDNLNEKASGNTEELQYFTE